MPQPDRSVPSTSSPRTSCRGRQLPLRDRRVLKGASWVQGIFIQVLTVWDSTCTFLPRPACPGKWSFEVSRSEGRGYYLVCCVGFRSWVWTHLMQYVEVCELLARAEERYYIMKQLAICFVTGAVSMVESFLSEVQQHPGVPCEALKFSSQ